MEIIFVIAFIVIGVIAGVIGGLLGISGGVVMVPSLMLVFHFMGFSQTFVMHSAIGTSLAAMVINGIASVTAHQRHKTVKWDLLLSAAPGLFLGCLLGSFLAHFMSGVLLQILFGLFICILGAYVLLQKNKPQKGAAKQPEKTLFTWFGLGIGTVSSMLGIGGGIFVVPLLISYRFSAQKVVGTSASFSLLITFLAAMSYLYFGLNAIELPWHIGYIYLPAFAIIGFTTLFSAPFGAKLAQTLNMDRLKRIFAIMLILVGILMIFN